LALMFAGARAAEDVIVFGDSWGAFGYSFLETMFKNHSNQTVNVRNFAVGGTTAQSWAAKPNQLTTDLKKYPNAKHMWLSIGGNDALDHGCPDEACEDQLMTVTTADVKKFLDPAFAAFPNLKLVTFFYDLTNNNDLCANLVARNPCHGNRTCIAYNSVRWQANYESMVQKLYPNNVVVIDILGTLQVAGHVAGASIGNPSLKQLSPPDLMESNCIHPNAKGWGYVMEEFWHQYWSKYF